uniref:Putative secreted protein n=1 Tax=Panstrongylus lignarius TaxID=156445 RepID=A0A224Y100_9HEMI
MNLAYMVAQRLSNVNLLLTVMEVLILKKHSFANIVIKLKDGSMNVYVRHVVILYHRPEVITELTVQYMIM